MSYYTILGLEKEPFSTSPDPEFFYDSHNHHRALMHLMIDIRLRRGMSAILGDVGVGKTTLLRKLIQMFTQRNDIIYGVIFDPTYEDEKTFISDLIGHFNIDFECSEAKLPECKEALKNFLFQKGVEENKITVLLIDEAQKLSIPSLEFLRGLLNYETNEYKLLQLVLLGQLELVPKLRKMPNFLDRISFKFLLSPLTEEETQQMIDFRLNHAGYRGKLPLFSKDAVKEMYQITGGYPRKITLFCHEALKEAVIRNVKTIDRNLVHQLFLEESKILNVR